MADKFNATITNQAVGGAGAVEQISEATQSKNVWEVAMGLVDKTVNVVKAIDTEKTKYEDNIRKNQEDDLKVLEANKAIVKAREDRAKWETMDPEEVDQEISNTYNTVMNGESQNSESYDENYLKQINETANKYANKSKMIKVSRAANMESTGILEQLNKGEIDPLEWTNKMSKKYGTDKTIFRDSLIINTAENLKNKMIAVDTPEELEELITNHRQFKNNFNTPEFYGSQSKGDFGELLKKTESDITKSYNLKLKEIKESAQSRISQTIGTGDTGDSNNSYIQPFNSELEKDFKTVYTNPIELNNQKNNYIKTYNEKEEARDFRSKHLITEPVDDIRVFNNKTIKTERQKDVTDFSIKSFEEGKYSELNSAINSNPGMGKEPINQLINTFDTTDDVKVMTNIVNGIKEASLNTGGGTAIRGNLSTKEYSRLMATQSLITTIYKDDIKSAKALVNTSIVNKGQNGSFSKDMFEKINKLEKGMGSQQGQFRTILQTLWDVNPELALDKADEVSEFIKSGIKKVDNTTINVSMGTPKKSFRNIEDEDWLEKKVLIQTPNASNISYFPGNKMLITDEWGASTTFIDATKIIENENELIKLQKVRESKNPPKYRIATEIAVGATADTITTLGKITTGLGGGLKDLGMALTKKDREENAWFYDGISNAYNSVFNEEVANGMIKGMNEGYLGDLRKKKEDAGFMPGPQDLIIDAVNWIFGYATDGNKVKKEHEGKKVSQIILEAQNEAIEEEKSKLVTEIPEVPVNTLSETENTQMQNAIYKNRIEKIKLEQKQERLKFTLKSFLEEQTKE